MSAERTLTQPRSPAHAEQREITKKLAARIDTLREERGLTVEQLAHKAELGISGLNNVRLGLVDPRLTTLLRLCGALRVTIDGLLGELPLPQTARPRRGPPAGTSRQGKAGKK